MEDPQLFSRVVALVILRSNPHIYNSNAYRKDDDKDYTIEFETFPGASIYDTHGKVEKAIRNLGELLSYLNKIKLCACKSCRANMVFHILNDDKLFWTNNNWPVHRQKWEKYVLGNLHH